MNEQAIQEIIIPNESAMLRLGTQLAKASSGPAIFFLYGDLGAGKTTLVRGFLRGWGYQGTVKSPTYTLVEPYEINNQLIFHFDFYRVREPQELEFIGIQDYFTPHAICLIEWPDLGGEQLPAADLSCYIEPVALGRKVNIIACSERGLEILKRIQNENSI